MNPREIGSAEAPFRLRGEIEGRERVFDLEIGELRVGSSSKSDLKLAIPGISRQHALLVVRREGLVVEDRGSRNGTFVDGRRIQRAAVVDGAELRFGPVALRLQARAGDDATIAIPLGPETQGSSSFTSASNLVSAITALDESFEQEDPETASTFPWLRLLDEVGEALVLGDRAFALRCLGEALGASGCCLLKISDSGSPLVEQSWGLLPNHPAGEAFEDPASGGAREQISLRSEPGSAESGPSCEIAVARAPAGRKTGLVIWDFPRELKGQRSLLRVLIRMFSTHGPAGSTEAPSPAAKPLELASLDFPPGFLVGSSPSLRDLLRQMERVAPAALPVLLTGPTGVGKGALAEVLHRSSPRRGGPLVSVNCAALPGELLEAELFGIGKGVATGVEARPGHFLAADGGTLFLDEIGELPLELQAKLLRALQEREIQPLGGAPRKIDVRILAATNADLGKSVQDGSFRRDLYFRLAGYVLDVPSLAACREDLPYFAGAFLRRFAEERGVFPKGLSLSALRALLAYSWPGNLRELEHEMRRLVLRCDPGQVIDTALLSPEILQPRSPGEAPSPPPEETLNLKKRLERVEGEVIREALEATGGIQLRAAELLGISRNGLARRMKRLGLS